MRHLREEGNAYQTIEIYTLSSFSLFWIANGRVYSELNKPHLLVGGFNFQKVITKACPNTADTLH